MTRTHALSAFTCLLLVVTGSACPGPEAELATIEVVSASLSDVDMGSGAVIVGGTAGTATLHVTDAAGATRSFPVTLEGPMVGPALTAQSQDSFGFDPPDGVIELPGPLPADQLFGLYEGSAAGIAFAVGVTEHELENQHGVKLKTDYLTVGIGFAAALEWLTMSLDVGGDDEPAADAGPADESGDAGTP